MRRIIKVTVTYGIWTDIPQKNNISISITEIIILKIKIITTERGKTNKKKRNY